MTGTCIMIITPSWEGSPDIECGKPATHVHDGVPCCEDCHRACAEQEERDAAARQRAMPYQARGLPGSHPDPNRCACGVCPTCRDAEALSSPDAVEREDGGPQP